MITFLKQGRFGASDAVPTDDAWSSPIPRLSTDGGEKS